MRADSQMNYINDINEDGNLKLNRIIKAESDIEYLRHVVGSMSGQ